jgi:GDP/UDP-N,N'-diacetylbacillosamine 2-epimerase (hydrolysing)
MKRRICVFTATRAEYGLLKALIAALDRDPELQLHLLVSGTHLSPEFGLTYKEIEADGFAIDERVEILLSSDTGQGVAKAMGLGLIGFGEAFGRMRPDLIVLLGDRFELLSAASAALVCGIPIAHIHGGETSEGALDEAVRHAVTKMAHLHFTAAEPYRRRVIQLGEAPERVHNVGGLGVDAIRNIPLMSRAELEANIGFTFRDRNLLVTFHPETWSNQSAAGQTAVLLSALAALGDSVGLLITKPNADAGGREIATLIDRFADCRDNVMVVGSLGQLRYFSAMAIVDGVVGNSSSGLAEAPTFGIGTVNIGSRQDGRLRASSIIDCPVEEQAISLAIHKLFEPEFRQLASATVNPYGDGGATARIIDVIRTTPSLDSGSKKFHDLPFEIGDRSSFADETGSHEHR